MAEVLVEFQGEMQGRDGRAYHAHAAARGRDDGRWEGWLEFLPLDGSEPVRTARETTQPNRQDVVYWATGLTTTYLEGALARALTPAPVVGDVAEPVVPSAFEAPAPHTPGPAAPSAILDPFAVYTASGPDVLRRQLGALSADQLRNIIRAYGLSGSGVAALATLREPDLVAIAMQGVERRIG